jgi:hypothetical protein
MKRYSLYVLAVIIVLFGNESPLHANQTQIVPTRPKIQEPSEVKNVFKVLLEWVNGLLSPKSPSPLSFSTYFVGTDNSTSCNPSMGWSPDGILAYAVSADGIWLLQSPNKSPVQLSEQGSQPVWLQEGQLAVLGNQPEWEQPWKIEVFDKTDGTIPPHSYQTEWYSSMIIGGWRDENHLALIAHIGSNADFLLDFDVETGTTTDIITNDISVISNAIGSAYYWSPVDDTVIVQRIPQRLTIVDVAAQTFIDLAQFEEQRYQRFEAWHSTGSQFLYEEWATPQDSANTPTPNLLKWDVVGKSAKLLVPYAWGADWSTTDKIAFYLLGNPEFGSKGNILGTDYVAGQSFDAHLGIMESETGQVIKTIPLGRVTNPNAFINGLTIANDMGQCGLPRPLWSPDGTQLVYWDAEGKTWLWDGKTSIALPSSRYGAWSLNSTWLALRGESELFLMDNRLD